MRRAAACRAKSPRALGLGKCAGRYDAFLPHGYLVFDASVLDKNYAQQIGVIRPPGMLMFLIEHLEKVYYRGYLPYVDTETIRGET